MHSETVTTSELASELKVPGSYIPKITKKLKEANIITASEGIKGGYSLAKKPEDISLFDIISATEVTMKINRCLEKDGFCSRNATDYCRVHKVLLEGAGNISGLPAECKGCGYHTSGKRGTFRTVLCGHKSKL